MAEQLIEQKLESLQRCVQRVQERIPATSEALANDPDSQDIVDLNLTRAIQLCAQIASHWVSRHTELPPRRARARHLIYWPKQASLIQIWPPSYATS